MFNNSRMLKMAEEVVHGHTRASKTENDEGWLGFVCKECGAPLAVHRSTAPSKTPERSTRGWRVTCTGCGVTEYYELGTPMVRITAS
jgi:RNase P subunit RPR2